MPALDGIDKLKGALKNIFKKKKKESAAPTSTAQGEASSSTTKPTETTPAQPAPASAPEPAKSETTPAESSAPPAPAPASAPAAAPTDDKAAEKAALAEVKKATSKRPSSSSQPSRTQYYGENLEGDGSRRRLKVQRDLEDYEEAVRQAEARRGRSDWS